MRRAIQIKRAIVAAGLALVAVAGGCDDSTDGGLYVPDAGDAGKPNDATVDSPPFDANPPVDASDDVSPGDTGADVVVDTGTDAKVDAKGDAADASTQDAADAADANEASVDAGPDVVDSGPDVADAGSDAVAEAGDAGDAEAGACQTIFAVTAVGTGAYVINGSDNPTLDVCKGDTVTFNIAATGHPFWLKTIQGASQANAYTDGVTGNGTTTGALTWVVSAAAPTPLYYNCEFHGAMTGIINVH